MLKPVFALLAPEEASMSQDKQLVKLSIKAHAVNTIRMLLVSQCASVLQYMPEYAVHIIGVFNQLPSVPETQRLKLRIVEGVTAILDYNEEVIEENMKAVLEMMYNALKETDSMVNMAACEFWSGLAQIWFSTMAEDDGTDPST